MHFGGPYFGPGARSVGYQNTFARQSTQRCDFADHDWLNDPALLVPQPGAHMFGPKMRVFITLCITAILFGILIALPDAIDGLMAWRGR